ncbi:hypothetical protein D3C75_1124320 [compost metagenome]
MDLPFVDRVGQILPAFGFRQVFLFKTIGVDAKTENADIHRRGVVAFTFGRIAELRHDLLQVRRGVRLQQVHFTSL